MKFYTMRSGEGTATYETIVAVGRRFYVSNSPSPPQPTEINETDAVWAILHGHRGVYPYGGDGLPTEPARISKIRRRIENRLRIEADPETIVGIAKILGVKISE